jgi:tripartite-type tricarboxylate transporter receptor subunit TctC
MFTKLPYAVSDFAPVALIATVPNVLAVPASSPVKTFQEFVDQAKAKPGDVTYGSAGTGSSGHLAMEFLAQKAGLKLTHVAYKGTGPMTTDLLAGQTQGTFTGVPPLLQHIKSGKLKALAVGSAKRVDALPDVPTVSELGFPGFETSQWYGILVPAKTPAPIVQRLSEAINRALKDPELIGFTAG